jgi:hypothetical protein
MLSAARMTRGEAIPQIHSGRSVRIPNAAIRQTMQYRLARIVYRRSHRVMKHSMDDLADRSRVAMILHVSS